MRFSIYPTYHTRLQHLLILWPMAINWMLRYCFQLLTANTWADISSAGLWRLNHPLVSFFCCPPLFVQECDSSDFRRGGALERGFKRVIRDVPLGSVLIQSDGITGEPLLLQLKLPLYIRLRQQAEKTWVFLLDAQVSSVPSSGCFPAGLALTMVF